jgi:hypothetical protein
MYVNKQECITSSWRSNQGYNMMHGQTTIKNIFWSVLCSSSPLVYGHMLVLLRQIKQHLT